MSLISLCLASAIIDLLPNALGPHSILPLNIPIISFSEIAFAISSKSSLLLLYCLIAILFSLNFLLNFFKELFMSLFENLGPR